jgi:hypothetical protein
MSNKFMQSWPMSVPIVKLSETIVSSVGVIERVKIITDRDPIITSFHLKLVIRHASRIGDFLTVSHLGTHDQERLRKDVGLDITWIAVDAKDVMKSLEGRKVWVEINIKNHQMTFVGICRE